jgi:hypothetical protein
MMKAQHTQRFFVDKVRDDLTPALTPVVLTWKKLGNSTLHPTKVRVGRELEFRWADHSQSYLTTVAMRLRKKGALIDIEIRERGWPPADLANAFENCSGWSAFLDHLRAYVLHGIDLRARRYGGRRDGSARSAGQGFAHSVLGFQLLRVGLSQTGARCRKISSPPEP